VHLNADFLKPDWLFQTPMTMPGYRFGVLTAALGLLLVLGLGAYLRRGKLGGDNPAFRRLIRRISKVAMWIAVIGLFLALMRYLSVPYLGIPILMYLLLLTMVLFVGYFVYELSERYPLASWKLEESHAGRRYRPTQKQRPAARPVKSRARGKRRR